MRVRTTQEMLDSRLILIGWRVYALIDNVRMYAIGNGSWTAEKARAFLFTDAPGSARKGNDDGRRWAWAHARHLISEHTKAQWPIASATCECMGDYDYDVLKPHVVCIRRRVYPQARPALGLAS